MAKFLDKVEISAAKAASHMFSKNKIMEQAMSGKHNGESMMEIYGKIMMAPNIRRDEIKPNVYNLYLIDEDKNKERLVGFMAADRGVGYIQQKAYDLVPDLSSEDRELIASMYVPLTESERDDLMRMLTDFPDDDQEAIRCMLDEDCDYDAYDDYDDVAIPKASAPLQSAPESGSEADTGNSGLESPEDDSQAIF